MKSDLADLMAHKETTAQRFYRLKEKVSTAINAAWRKGGMEGHVTSTLFRKSAVTNVHKGHKK